MEKPRSDIFPFLDRVTYLCLGDVVYTGATRMMLDYFRAIGFPCPELENPLMYYCKFFKIQIHIFIYKSLLFINFNIKIFLSWHFNNYFQIVR